MASENEAGMGGTVGTMILDDASNLMMAAMALHARLKALEEAAGEAIGAMPGMPIDGLPKSIKHYVAVSLEYAAENAELHAACGDYRPGSDLVNATAIAGPSSS